MNKYVLENTEKDKRKGINRNINRNEDDNKNVNADDYWQKVN